ncbi:MAG: hypothetical protein ACK5JU_04955 [Bacteroidales bacterium]
MEEIIQNIQNRLVANVPALKYIDQDWGQMDFYPNHPVKYPCALIDIQSAQYTDIGRLIQEGVATVVINIYDLRLSNSSQAAPQTQKDNAMKIWALVKEINKAIHGQNILNDHGIPMRQRMRRTKRNDGIYLTELIYTIQFTDDSCQPQTSPITATPTIHTVGLLR